MRKTLKTRVTLALVLAPRAAFACPVCFGQSDSPLAKATNLGILVMLGFVGAVLVGFATFFIYLIRRANAAATDSVDAGSQFNEGTA